MISLLAILLLAQATPAGPTGLEAAAEKAREAGSADAPERYRQALAANPKWQEGWWALGSLEYSHDHFPDCRNAFRSLVKLAPKSGPGLTMLGLCEVGSHQDEEAILHLKQGLDLGPGPTAIGKVARYQLARLYVANGSFEPALAEIARLAQNVPDSPAYFSLAGVAALWKRVMPEAVPENERELVYLAGRGFWFAALGKAALAAEALKDLETRYPDSPGVHYLIGSFKLRDQTDEAPGQFLAELKINPTHVGALSALAAEYLREGDPAKALPYARKLEELLPDAMPSHVLLGRILAEQGETDAAVRELERARAIDPDHPEPHITLASLYAKLGRKQDAANERKEFLRLKDRVARIGDP